MKTDRFVSDIYSSAVAYGEYTAEKTPSIQSSELVPEMKEDEIQENKLKKDAVQDDEIQE